MQTKIPVSIGTYPLPYPLSQRFMLSGKLISDAGNKKFLSAEIGVTNLKHSVGLGAGFNDPNYRYLVDSPIDVFESFDYLDIKISVDQSLHRLSELSTLSIKLDEYINGLDEVIIETYVNTVRFLNKNIRRNDLKKTGDFEYSVKINWRDIFKQDGGAKKYYLRLVKNEKERFNPP